ncbi:Methyltransferase domain protein [Planctomyces sp. SH-PL14]|nr:Methyltransferase domain protein [Planctomyces sp. SH-PL14]
MTRSFPPPLMFGSLVRRLSLSPTAQGIIKSLGLIHLGNGVLRMAGVVRQVPQSRWKYRVRFVDTPVLADGIFRDGEYRLLAGDADRIRTFIDLGCNVGLFPLYLSSIKSRDELTGILVDANSRVVAEARENMRLNGLSDRISVIHGLAGAAGEGEGEVREFWIAQNSLSSTAHPELLTSRVGLSTEKVAVVDVLKEFRKACGDDARVDLLKLDIEGCEIEFLKTNRPLLDLCERVILEFHKPQVTLADAESALGPGGFRLVGVHDDAGRPWGVAYFRR